MEMLLGMLGSEMEYCYRCGKLCCHLENHYCHWRSAITGILLSLEDVAGNLGLTSTAKRLSAAAGGGVLSLCKALLSFGRFLLSLEVCCHWMSIVTRGLPSLGALLSMERAMLLLE